MLTVEQALSRVLAAVRPPLAERVPIDRALGRLLAESVRCPRDIPPWDNSAMDGFAVRSADLSEAARLRVLETIGAGKMPKERVVSGTCSRIMTGAPMPEGADAVVMVENTDGGVGEVVQVRVPVRPGENVRPKGDDVPLGALVLEPGYELDPPAVGLLSSLGLPSVMVAQRPRVAILSTGDEVVEAGFPVSDAQIWSSNTLSLIAQVREAGGEPIHCGIAPDSPDGLREALARCKRADLVITTGGVSVGDFDYVKEVLGDEGASLDFWRVAMQPGKPLAFGWLGGVPLFGLPGNPVSCMVNFYQFVRPVLRSMLGDPRPYLPVIEAVLAGPIRKRPGRAMFSRVRLDPGAERPRATPVSNQSSGVLMSMVRADGLALLGAEQGDLAEGELVRVQVLRGSWQRGAGPEYGW